MSLLLLATSFLAGLLTVIAPCVLPLLPIIIGGSLIDHHRWRPFVIVLSLALSMILFTFLLKVFSLFVNVPQTFWMYLSASIISFFALTLIFPTAWDWISFKLQLSNRSERALESAASKHSIWGAIFLGASLGPVFSSCSPTYFVILATVLPVSLWQGTIYLISYALGLMLILWLIAHLGRSFTKHLKWIANPYGWFKKSLGVLLLLVGVALFFGWDKSAESYLIGHGLGSTQTERTLLGKINFSQDEIATRKTSSDETAAVLAMTADNEAVISNFGPAPELVGLTGWINSKPLTLQDLRGKVVLIDFWTYSCINCLRTLPYVEKWYKQYASKGLVVIGISDPEFQFEKNWHNVYTAVKAAGITYPIALDNQHETWNAYHNQYWPAKYLIDKEGNIRYFHYGEGDYENTEKVIQQLLQIQDKPLFSTSMIAQTSMNSFLTPETYLGSYRRDRQVPWGEPLALNAWSINPLWDQSDPEKITTLRAGAAIKLNFYASTANLVLSGKGHAQVLVDGMPLINHAGKDVKNGILMIDGSRLYQLTDFNNQPGDHVIELIFNQPGIDAYAWTFG